MKYQLIAIFLLFSCVENTKNKKQLGAIDSITPPDQYSCHLGDKPVCGEIVTKKEDDHCYGSDCSGFNFSFKKITFPSACHAQNNGALVLHQGACAQFCPTVTCQKPDNFCEGPGESFYCDYGEGGCQTEAKCHYMPCPQFARRTHLEACPSNQAYEVFKSFNACYNGYNCRENIICPREYPLQDLSCSNGQLSANYDSNKCITNLSCN